MSFSCGPTTQDVATGSHGAGTVDVECDCTLWSHRGPPFEHGLGTEEGVMSPRQTWVSFDVDGGAGPLAAANVPHWRKDTRRLASGYQMLCFVLSVIISFPHFQLGQQYE